MDEEVTVRSDTFYCTLWLRHLADIPDRNWKRICRMLPRDSRNDESVRALREWFPEAIKRAKEEKADAAFRVKAANKDPATVPKKLRTVQRQINEDNLRGLRSAERTLKTLEARYQIFNDYTKEI